MGGVERIWRSLDGISISHNEHPTASLWNMTVKRRESWDAECHIQLARTTSYGAYPKR